MIMFATGTGTRDYWRELSEMTGSVTMSIPTFDRQLDNFFEKNASAIIDEWDLITDEDLSHIQRRLEYLSYEVNRLVVSKGNLEKRVSNLSTMIGKLEENL